MSLELRVSVTAKSRHEIAMEWLAQARDLGIENPSRRQLRKAMQGRGFLRDEIERKRWEKALGIGEA